MTCIQLEFCELSSHSCISWWLLTSCLLEVVKLLIMYFSPVLCSFSDFFILTLVLGFQRLQFCPVLTSVTWHFTHTVYLWIFIPTPRIKSNCFCSAIYSHWCNRFLGRRNVMFKNHLNELHYVHSFMRVPLVHLFPVWWVKWRNWWTWCTTHCNLSLCLRHCMMV